MTLSDVLAIGLGLAFTYALFSMLASVIKEAIAAKLQWRAKSLGDAIRAMLEVGGNGGGGWEKLTDRVYGHALVSGISTNLKPSYLPARNFTLALLDELTAGGQAPAVTAVESAVASLPDGDLKQRLTTYVNEAAGDFDVLKTHLDAWFDDTMDRLSGVYKRYTQFVLLIIGLCLAVALNVNTLKIVSVLQHNEHIRTAAATMAEAYQKAHVDSAANANAAQVEDAISSLPVPIGWTFCDGSGNDPCKNARWARFGVVLAEGTSPWAIVAELVGWLLTGIAISFGAPFWFDLLGQLVNIRSAGPKPPRADAQADDATQ